MKWSKISIVAALIVSVFALSHFASKSVSGSREMTAANLADSSEKQFDLRIVAAAPSTCEILYALGLGENVVGVSRFTTYPPEAVEKRKIGGYLDVDLEALLRLKPDVVVLLVEQQSLSDHLEKLGLKTVFVDHMSVAGILESITTLGEVFDVSNRAIVLRSQLEKRVARIKASSATAPTKTVLFSIGREMGQAKVNSLFAAGAGGYHQELLTLANLKNAYTGSENFPQLTREHLIKLNPDLIIDMVTAKGVESIGESGMLADWSAHSELKAVSENHVYILAGDQHFVPGPRFIETLEWIHKVAHGGEHE